ncbi:GTPase Era involved in 16S rRNA processing [Nocardioides marinisabuli]|uniref:GTPase Era involved in 16S rRNA processing n=1 Tax=Nocardioides marinisabuli TaxID=419476 RepID=A0A7Y9JR54_9ACTN|nr:GTPase [Nocardioides marinisabuli]NYD58150.1 GTPase Era involved in 16S rRNA processing [Nocardioides marinisabuli]
MTSLLEGAKKLVTRGTDTGARIDGLAAAAEAARGRLDDALVDDAEKVVDRATSRLRLSAAHTVVAIAGATGSGKSSTFNALTGLELSAVGVRRPTTSWATACVWGSDGAGELLDWLGIPPRHQTTRDSMLDTRRESQALEGVVLLDLPDHDSTEVSHHLEVDRLVALADMLVWVLDPQKYADAAIHDRYLAPLKTHEGVMVVVLNHIDTVPAEGREAMLADVRRLLEADGLGRVPVIGISARQGLGLDELRGEIESRVRAKKMTAERIESDVRAAAARLQEAGGAAPTRALSDQRVHAMQDAFAEAAGVPTVVEAVERSTRLRAGRATGWPLVSWTSRLRPDPLKKMQLDLGGSAKALRGRESAVPQTTSVQRARVDSEVRSLVDEATQGLGRPWADAVRRASVHRLPEIGDRLDDALRGVDLQTSRIPVWAGVVRVLQWVLVVTALVGGAWTVATALSGTLDDTPVYAGVALPLLLLLGGVGLGVLLALVCRGLVAGTARRRASVADTRLREAVGAVAHDLVVSPVEAELAAYTRARGGLSKALAER